MKKKLLFIFPTLLMIIIYSLSAQKGNESSSLSLLVYNLLPFHFLDKDTAIFIIRKCAHMSEYAVLALSFFIAFKYNGFNRYYFISFICTFLYACTDELHQLFVADRAGQFTDVLIDSSGALIILTMLYIIKRLLPRQ